MLNAFRFAAAISGRFANFFCRKSVVDSVGADPLSVLRSLGVRPSDVLSADRLLVLEGLSDQDVLEAWFPEVLRNPRVAILAGDGGDSAVHADRLAAWLAGADRTGLQRVVYMRDRDELAPSVLEKLTSRCGGRSSSMVSPAHQARRSAHGSRAPAAAGE